MSQNKMNPETFLNNDLFAIFISFPSSDAGHSGAGSISMVLTCDEYDCPHLPLVRQVMTANRAKRITNEFVTEANNKLISQAELPAACG
ncbi:MAG: hypothetical protein ACKO85_19165 [Isosphaeraceae bacterium]